MSIPVTCPGCAYQMKVAEALADSIVKCRGCGQMVRVPPPLAPAEKAALEQFQNKVNAELFGEVNLADAEELISKAGKAEKVSVVRCIKCKHAMDPDLDVCPYCGQDQRKGLNITVHAARKFRRSLGSDIGSLQSDVQSSLRATMLDFQGVSSRKLFALSVTAVVLGLAPLAGLALPAIAGVTQYLPFLGLFIGLCGGVVYYFTGDSKAATLGLSGTVGAVVLSIMLVRPYLFPQQSSMFQPVQQVQTQPAKTPAKTPTVTTQPQIKSQALPTVEPVSQPAQP